MRASLKKKGQFVRNKRDEQKLLWQKGQQGILGRQNQTQKPPRENTAALGAKHRKSDWSQSREGKKKVPFRN